MPARTVVTSAARTAASNSGPVAIQSDTHDDLNLTVDVTAVSGTGPTLDVSVEWSNDGTNFGVSDAPDTFAQITTTKRVVDSFNIKGPFYRVVWTVGGTTPSFTFAVTEFTD